MSDKKVIHVHDLEIYTFLNITVYAHTNLKDILNYFLYNFCIYYNHIKNNGISIHFLLFVICIFHKSNRYLHIIIQLNENVLKYIFVFLLLFFVLHFLNLNIYLLSFLFLLIFFLVEFYYLLYNLNL